MESVGIFRIRDAESDEPEESLRFLQPCPKRPDMNEQTRRTEPAPSREKDPLRRKDD